MKKELKKLLPQIKQLLKLMDAKSAKSFLDTEEIRVRCALSFMHNATLDFLEKDTNESSENNR